ncbi:MAG: DnaJ domain-containing protein [Chitinophagaceae bacterium]
MFSIKNYFGILGVEPSASLPEIKKAYRLLAKKYHPDKNQQDPYAAVRFAEIKEAYEVLTDPAKKDYYLQQRWYNQSAGRRRTMEIVTPVNVLKQSLELERYVSALDVFRMDKAGLRDYILSFINDAAVTTLNGFDEQETIRQIIRSILLAIKPLPKMYADPVISQLNKLAAKDTRAINLVSEYTVTAGRRHRREKYSLLFIIIVTILLCLLIWLAGH